MNILLINHYAGKINSSHILSENPRLDYLRVLQEFFVPKQTQFGIRTHYVRYNEFTFEKTLKKYLNIMNKQITNDIIQWDIESWKKILPYWEHAVDWNRISSVLAIGEREGGLALFFALKGKSVLCTDLKESLRAQPLHIKHKVEHLIVYKNVDVTNIPFSNEFDSIIFKSVIGGVGYGDNYSAQQKAFEQMHKALKPDGVLLFSENLKASKLHHFFRTKFVKWSKNWRYLTLQEMKDNLENYSKVEIKTTGFLATFGRNERQRRCLAYLDKLLFNKCCPSRWHYIAYGIATK